MYWWRITKYNPAYRNESGAYLKADWISEGDIGKTFDGKKLTLKEYIKIETAYINAVLAFMDCLEINYLIIFSLDKFSTPKKMGMPANLLRPYKKIEGSRVSKEKITDYMRLLLRNYLWCKLKYPYRMQIHIGYDYYMYIGASRLCPNTIQAIEKSRLFVEPFLSPYL